MNNHTPSISVALIIYSETVPPPNSCLSTKIHKMNLKKSIHWFNWRNILNNGCLMKHTSVVHTWMILTLERDLTRLGTLSVFLSGGCPSVPLWFHPQVYSCVYPRKIKSRRETKRTWSRRKDLLLPGEKKRKDRCISAYIPVFAYGEGVPTAGDNGDNVLRFQWPYAVHPILLFPIPHPQLPVLPRAPTIHSHYHPQLAPTIHQNTMKCRHKFPSRGRNTHNLLTART